MDLMDPMDRMDTMDGAMKTMDENDREVNGRGNH